MISEEVATAMGEYIDRDGDGDSDNDNNYGGGEYLYTVSSDSSSSLDSFGSQGTRKVQRIGSITSDLRLKVFSLEISKKSDYVDGTDANTVGILESDPRAETMCDGREFRSLSGTIVVYDFDGFLK